MSYVIMTSEVNTLETNDFQRRRKLRLQQVREQSKDIAKKIRERANKEKFRQVVELDTKKQQEYFQRQERLVKHLEEYYAKGIKHLGTGHKNAKELNSEDEPDKVDLSKQRGKEAAAELRKKRQEALDKQKKILDRKLQAREAANELSREKSATVINKLQSKASSVEVDDSQNGKERDTVKDSNQPDDSVKHTDMATQWEVDEIPHEWEPNIPILSLPKDDNISVKESNNNESKSDKSKRNDLFALSEEMPSSLRGGLTNEQRVPTNTRPSLTLVSEFSHNRDLRLRESDSVTSKKKTEDLQSLRQTIMRARVTKEGKSSEDKVSRSSLKSSEPSSNVPQKKNSVTMYNHSTRDSRNIPCTENRHVVRNTLDDEDAYSQAMKEATSEAKIEKDNKKLQEIRTKVAVTKQNVEKEYRDTISFLNSLPKDTSNKPIRNAFMDEHRQQEQKDGRQRRMQQEFKNIMKCSKHSSRTKAPRKSKSPVSFQEDFQYSWMPVPESDSNLAIHTIPTSLKGGSTNSVMFSKVDSYHEYRSRHKHTPPTKDTMQEKQKLDSSSDAESIDSETSRELKLSEKTELTNLSDAEGIVIYKILDCKKDKNVKKKLVKEIAKSLTNIDKTNESDAPAKESVSTNHGLENRVTFEQLDEGVYKTVNQSGGDNIATMYFRDDKIEHCEDKMSHRVCHCDRLFKEQSHPRQGTSSAHWEGGDNIQSRTPTSCTKCICGCRSPKPQARSKPLTSVQQSNQTILSSGTSTTSFKTTTTDRAVNPPPNGGFIKVVDEGGEEAGKFFIGTSGFLKDDAYEVVIQLRKKGDEKKEDEDKPETVLKIDNYPKEPPIREISSEQEEQDKETARSEKQVKGIQNKTDNESQTISNNETELTPERQDVGIQNSNDAPTTSKVVKDMIDVKDSVSDTLITQLVHKFLSEHYENLVPSTSNENKNVAEKAVSTSFQDSIVLKPDTAQPVAASTCTQTTAPSPSHRPVFFHMSSSTSTAYMSPPDTILPKFLKAGFHESNNDTKNYETDDNITMPHYCEYDCRCDKSVMQMSVGKMINLTKFKSTVADDMRAPPNTARSEGDSDIQCNKKGKTKEHHAKLHSRKKHKCRKSDSAKRLCTKRGLPNKHVTSSSSKDCKYNSELNKCNLNPTVKDYVHKLLTLNRESLKAVEVMDQECSSVTTPGSSIIELKDNKGVNKNGASKISLEQIKIMMKRQILKDYISEFCHDAVSSFYSDTFDKKQPKCNKSLRRKKSHKIKSLNISKHLFKPKDCRNMGPTEEKTTSSSSSRHHNDVSKPSTSSNKAKVRSSSSPTPRNKETVGRKKSDKEMTKRFETSILRTDIKVNPINLNQGKCELPRHTSTTSNSCHPTATSESESSAPQYNKHDSITNIPTQTRHIDSELNFVKLAESKLQNMEKIADLTEKCTKRLSNLAKVLEEVRKNKSLAYSQMSSLENTSDSDQKSDKNPNKLKHSSDPNSEAQNPTVTDNLEQPTPTVHQNKEYDNIFESTNVPYLSNIPKLTAFSTSQLSDTSSSSSKTSGSPRLNTEPLEYNAKHRPRPPPALPRNLKNGQDFIVPHELSTVVEVDSPMSLKTRSHVSRNDTKADLGEKNNSLEMISSKLNDRQKSENGVVNKSKGNPDLLEVKADLTSNHTQVADSTDDSRMHMLELKQFNEIMLKPYFSIQEYAKRYNIETLDDGSNFEDVQREEVANEELSSLHSDGSLPDVISELLKRNLISEPFKFDSGSNVNSTTISSESTFSVLALTKATKEKKKSSVMFQNKENIGETSDTLSLSSNPDLENAFKKLGMGWASSTLKKTKERLALSSSSNTSSSSLPQFKIKTFNQEPPTLINDTVSSAINSSKPLQKTSSTDSPKNMEQQTSLTNTMTVKEFLTKELAKKITFNNKSKNETEEEFVSLFETQMPDEMKLTSRGARDENSMDNSASVRSGNRARTSTPVQLFKSMTYHSSSSSNLSNGLFSNADDLSSVKITSNSMKHSTSEKDDLTIPNFSLKMKKGSSECSKSE